MAKRVLWFGISDPIILICDAPCPGVLRGWFAIWFANGGRACRKVEGRLSEANHEKHHVCSDPADFARSRRLIAGRQR